DAEVGTPSTTTDSTGVARSTWTLGTVAGPQSVSVNAAGITRTAAATAIADDPDSISIVAGDGQVIVVGEEFGAAVAVIVRDAYGNPVENATVNFSVDGGDAMGTLGDDQVDTNANGLAWTTVTAGFIEDFIEVGASLDATRSVNFMLLAQTYGVGECIGHGPSFQSLKEQVRVGGAGVYEASSAAGDHLLQIRVADAIDGIPEAGQVTTGVLLVCEDAGGSQYVQFDALGVRLDGGEPDYVDISTPLISATYDTSGWRLECASGGIVAFVADAFGETLPLVHVTTGTATDGICLWDWGDPAPQAVAGPTLFVP
ncbi:MAG TPA: Ig-like domain-containing protein, partial [Vulgatibacter sp.]|nr:Ig-like domain-containing protein [Vulgatibacter sp.]